MKEEEVEEVEESPWPSVAMGGTTTQSISLTTTQERKEKSLEFELKQEEKRPVRSASLRLRNKKYSTDEIDGLGIEYESTRRRLRWVDSLFVSRTMVMGESCHPRTIPTLKTHTHAGNTRD